MKEKCQAKVYTCSCRTTPTPLDASTRRLWSIMAMAAKDIEDMCNEKGAEWPEEQR